MFKTTLIVLVTILVLTFTGRTEATELQVNIKTYISHRSNTYNKFRFQ